MVLAVSEAASNSVEHAYHPATADDTVDVTFWTEPHAMYIEIVDHGVWQTPSDQPTGRGRGIEIMQHVAFVLIRHDARGTRVLLRHPLSGDPLAPLHLAPSVT
jgi:anti-sigma regulatory factor (Ser/Thr protein kinase)